MYTRTKERLFFYHRHIAVRQYFTITLLLRQTINIRAQRCVPVAWWPTALLLFFSSLFSFSLIFIVLMPIHRLILFPLGDLRLFILHKSTRACITWRTSGFRRPTILNFLIVSLNMAVQVEYDSNVRSEIIPSSFRWLDGSKCDWKTRSITYTRFRQRFLIWI